MRLGFCHQTSPRHGWIDSSDSSFLNFMGLSSVKTFAAASERPLMREVAEVPKYLIEDFTRHLFRMGPTARVFPSQMEFTVGEINTGKADFIGWLLEKNPQDIPDCDQTLGDFLQRVSRDAARKVRDSLLAQQNQSASGEAAEIPTEVFHEYVREVLEWPTDSLVTEEAIDYVVNGIADGRYDFPGWARERGMRLS
jgi:hypothetical protein